jgi:prepilin-type processing-associated H-X9-DG protein
VNDYYGFLPVCHYKSQTGTETYISQIWAGKTVEYINSKVFACPADLTFRWPDSASVLYGDHGISYGYNRMYLCDGSYSDYPLKPIRDSKLKKPSRTILSADSKGAPDGTLVISFYLDPLIYQPYGLTQSVSYKRHSGNACFLMGDGHVQAMSVYTAENGGSNKDLWTIE